MHIFLNGLKNLIWNIHEKKIRSGTEFFSVVGSATLFLLLVSNGVVSSWENYFWSCGVMRRHRYLCGYFGHIRAYSPLVSLWQGFTRVDKMIFLVLVVIWRHLHSKSAAFCICLAIRVWSLYLFCFVADFSRSFLHSLCKPYTY